MKTATKEAWNVFWSACKETPRGMLMPFIKVWKSIAHSVAPLIKHEHEHKPSTHA